MAEPTHEISVNRRVQAACCDPWPYQPARTGPPPRDEHTTMVAECSCGWAYNEDRRPGVDASTIAAAIQNHKIDLLLEKVDIPVTVAYKEPQGRWARL